MQARKTKIIAGAVLFLASFALLVQAGGEAPVAPRPVQPTKKLEPLYRALAGAAQGRRVLVLHRRPEPSGEIFASAMTPTGWALFPGAPPESADYAAALDALARSAAADYFEDASLSDDTVKALRYFYVRFAAVEDGGLSQQIDVGERNPRLSWLSDIQAVELRTSQPTYELVGEPELEEPGDVLHWGRKLVTNEIYPASLTLDGPPWEVSMRLDVERAGAYLLPWASTGARVELDGVAVIPKEAAIPAVVLDLSPGSHDIVVRYRDVDAGGWVTIAAAFGGVLGLGLILLGIRPVVPPAPAHPQPDTEAAPPPDPGA